MQYLSTGYSLNDLFFSVFAGLRGSVSLALCIVIQTHIDSDKGNSAGIGYISFPKDEIRQVKQPSG
jgi:NhaP-type Na+/H+ or K+/H+ antiporter